MFLHFRTLTVSRVGGNDVEVFIALLHFFHQAFNADVARQAIPNVFAHLLPEDLRVGFLVADGEEIALFAPLVITVDGGVTRHKVERQFIALMYLAAAAPF